MTPGVVVVVVTRKEFGVSELVSGNFFAVKAGYWKNKIQIKYAKNYFGINAYQTKMHFQRALRPDSFSVQPDLKWVLVRQEEDREGEEEELHHARYFLHSLEGDRDGYWVR